MDRFGEWRPIAPAAKTVADEQSSAPMPARPADSAEGPEANASSVRLFGLLGAAGLAVVGGAIWLTNPGAGPEPRLDTAAAARFLSIPTPASFDDGPRFSAPVAELVVDIQGAVVQAGVHRLPAGSRVGDAIDAAGGYSKQVDLAAASATLNLAAPLADGTKIHIPARGEAAAATPAGGGSSNGGPTTVPINVNTAMAEELDTLPGIGPVTAAKIIAAREQAPFATIDELLSRQVVGSATLEKIRTLITVAP